MTRNLPETIFWSVTTQCNNSCSYCYAAKKLKRISLKRALSVIELFKQAGVKRVVITGGEPLLHPNIDEIIKKIAQNGIVVNLDTNGDYFWRHKDIILQYVDFLGLPIDYASGDRSYRKNGNFENNMRILKFFSTNHYKTRIRVGTVVTKQNLSDLPSIFKLLQGFKIDLWKIYQFIPMGVLGRKNESELLIDNDTYVKATDFLKNVQKPFKVVYSTRLDRSKAYFFLEANGLICLPDEYTADVRGTFMGKIEDPIALEKWYAAANYRNYEKNVRETFLVD